VGTTSPPLEFGLVYVNSPSSDEESEQGGIIDVGAELVRNGWAKVRESKRGENDDESEQGSRRAFLRDLEEDAKSQARGLWSSSSAMEEEERKVDYQMPQDPNEFLLKYKGKPIDGKALSLTFNSWLLIPMFS